VPLVNFMLEKGTKAIEDFIDFIKNIDDVIRNVINSILDKLVESEAEVETEFKAGQEELPSI